MRWILVVLLVASPLARSEKTWVARRLVEPRVEKWSLQDDKALVLVFFKADCPPCLEQIEQTQCLINDAVDVKLVGTFSSEKELKREYLKMKTAWPAFYGDPEILKSFDITAEATPQTMVITKQGRHLRVGVWPCKDLRKKIKEWLS